jgi:hypothetical protein
LSGRSEFATPNADAIKAPRPWHLPRPPSHDRARSAIRVVQRFPGSTPIGPESRCVCCRRNLLRPSGDFACEGKISLAKRLISLAKRFCFARHPRKLLKSLGHEIDDFAVSCVPKDPFFFALSFLRPFSNPPVVPGFILVSRKFIDTTNSIPGKAKRRVVSRVARFQSHFATFQWVAGRKSSPRLRHEPFARAAWLAGGSRDRCGAKARQRLNSLLGSIGQTEIRGLHGFIVHERSMKQATLDIGFRKEKCRYSEKARMLVPSSPFAPGGDCKEERATGASLILVCARFSRSADKRRTSEADVCGALKRKAGRGPLTGSARYPYYKFND